MPDNDCHPSPLRELLAHIEATRLATGSAVTVEEGDRTTCSQASPASVLNEFQQLWGRVRTDSQLRQSLSAVPEDAGPLHSSALLHRAMGLMQEVAPGYLQHFIAYVDALSWTEQLQSGNRRKVETDAAGSRRKPGPKPRSRK